MDKLTLLYLANGIAVGIITYYLNKVHKLYSELLEKDLMYSKQIEHCEQALSSLVKLEERFAKSLEEKSKPVKKKTIGRPKKK